MRIHHLNCATFCPFGGHFTDGMTPGIGSSKIVCHTLLIESERGLILIDTGLGVKDVDQSEKRIEPWARKILRPSLIKEETALFQIIQMGFRPEDVRHIVLTHLDFDHAGGINDFPNAQVHVMHAERNAAITRKNKLAQRRYNPLQLTGTRHWNTYFPEGEHWFGFQSVQDLEGLPPEILFIPLIGHTEGHAGVAIQTDRGWLLHAGDAYFYRGEMEAKPHCTPALKLYQRMMDTDHDKRIMNQQRLRKLSSRHPYDVTIFSAHDAVEYLSLKEDMPRYLYNKNFEAFDESDLSGLGLS